ncbi:undecaprenyldiphospho-muramoylpentapeptide beta-N-acetylglucosaminyltransferase [Synechococcales cyanobacterium C]|uniref:UDP-N-acetylglucosamine--N-acetylmuramyl-(pentapeptide) pyrophosphoryl-undecaprenol N-acetylglucosamine transferase n=1 Tax=Petrachloros mirabilis ULC683 TaxID=2781853 RepID=A0A8K1ZZF6_9CYAN|nr:undecaprenyldiphospho-muramoylpentapeptide beta-N-acetylglucosaminyltransferase [Petrachloros mirabilis]NCJ06776.1 undecaprenyldiphospho-muramoylpentapeptide beta-N-acetylglucosaminyltransferase [Petrachloros mirabilis ULC683]
MDTPLGKPLSSGNPRLLVAASGTGGHLFPAIAVADALAQQQVQIEWLGVPDRLETQLVPQQYRLHTIAVEGFQGRPSLGTLRTLIRFGVAIWQTRKLLKTGKFQGVLTTGGYIAAPAILAAKSLGLPSVLHDSNALPGKVTRFLSAYCSVVALGFAAAVPYLPKAKTTVVGTPVRDAFQQSNPCDLPIPDGALLIVVTGGSQGAVALNKLVRECAPAWLEAGTWIVHLTGDRDPDLYGFEHPHYLARPFYDQMAGLLQRADLAISRAGAGTLTELAITGTPSILVPYPYAAEDHQAYNAAVFTHAGAALSFRQQELTAGRLEEVVLELLKNPKRRQAMAADAQSLAVQDSTAQFAAVAQQVLL